MFDGPESRLPVGAQRLLTLAAFLDTLHPEQFDIRLWSSVRDPRLTPEGEPTCGTVCCAGGYAALMPVFQAQGLTFGPSGNQFVSDQIPVYRGKIGFEALADFFELAIGDAQWAFSNTRYFERPSPREVAGRLRLLTEKVTARAAAKEAVHA